MGLDCHFYILPAGAGEILGNAPSYFELWDWCHTRGLDLSTFRIAWFCKLHSLHEFMLKKSGVPHIAEEGNMAIRLNSWYTEQLREYATPERRLYFPELLPTIDRIVDGIATGRSAYYQADW